MEIIRMPVGVYAANSYIVYSEKDKKGLVIDPGGSPKKLIEKIEELGLTIEYILLTHGHGDHIGGVDAMREYLKVPVLVHEDDDYMLADPEANLAVIMPSISDLSTKADGSFKEGDSFDLGDLKIKVIHTPGHTPGGTTFDINGRLFTGDTLFAGSVGRSDFVGSSSEALMESIKTKLFKYPDETEVYPGHGASTTIKAEKTSNPFLK